MTLDENIKRLCQQIDNKEEENQELRELLKGCSLIAKAWLDGESPSNHVLRLAAHLLIANNK